MFSNEELLEMGWRERYDDILDETYYIPPAVPLEFVPHPDAPLFETPEQGRAILTDLLERMSEPDYQLSPTDLDIYRQAGLVSLWFFLKFIASYSGPYGDLTDHVHVDMCNFRQSLLKPGERGAFFIFRSGFKSTIGTHGATTWELVRDPNLRIAIVSATVSRAEEFLQQVQRNFDSNPMIRALYPNHCPPRDAETGAIKAKMWKRDRFILPNRTKDYPEPTLQPLGALGSTAGIHVDLLVFDDLVQEKQLNAMHEATDEMIKIRNWVESNSETLLISPKYSRIFLAGTRYSIEDPYEHIMQHSYEHLGHWENSPYEIDPEGVWKTYYRQAVENDLLTFPEKIDFKFLKRLKEKNYWAYVTQYMNNAHAAELSEFRSYNLKEANLDFSAKKGYTIHYFDGEHKTIPLDECEVTMGIDPAASEKRKSAKTSRTAIVIKARDANDNRFFIDGAVGYYTPSQFYGHIFRLYEKYKYYLTRVNMEAHGGFKYVFNSLREEMRRRQTFMPLIQISPLPDKDGKLRNYIQPLLERGLLFGCPPIAQHIQDEIQVFPGGTKRDLMDAMEIADRGSIKPRSTSEINDIEKERNSWRSKVKSRAGY